MKNLLILTALASLSIPAIAENTDAQIELVENFVETVNSGDTDGFIAMFDDDGILRDGSREFDTPEAILEWNNREFIGANGEITVKEILTEGDETILRAGWASEYYSGDSRFTFTFDGNEIQVLQIGADK